ncbi:MAG: hypothetical protein J6K71_01645, partial [Clostridia bacterium]|nr:hypothetical protein [Clostridia bacterium]
IWENSSDLKEKHQSKATDENYKFLKQEEVKISEIDDDEIHINEHISFMLSGEFETLKNSNLKLESTVLEHIKMHKKQKSLKEV